MKKNVILLVIIIAVSLNEIAAIAAEGKLTYRYDSARSGYVNSPISPELRLNWFYNTNENDKNYIYNPKTYCSIVGVGSLLFFGDLRNHFCAFDTVTKKYKWRFETSGQVQSGAAIDEDKIYFGDTKGYLYCLNIATGEIVWKQDLKHEFMSTPLIADSKIYLTTMADTLYCLEKRSGNIEWKVNVESYLKKTIRAPTAPSYSDGRLYQGFSDGYLYCFDVSTSSEIFRKKVKIDKEFFDVDSPAVIDKGKVYVSSFDGNFINILSDKPETIWELKLKGGGSPAYNNDSVIVSSFNGTLYKINKEIGNIVWEVELSPDLVPPVVTNNYVFVGSRDYFYVVNILNGKVEYKYEPGSGICSELYVLNNNVYFLSNKGYLYCFKAI